MQRSIPEFGSPDAMVAEERVVFTVTTGRLGGIVRRIRRDPTMMIGLVGVLLFVLLAAVGPLLTSASYLAIDIPDRTAPPSLMHLFGTDQFGRDLLSRVAYGSRVALLVGVFSTLIGTIVGVAIGAFSGFVGGWVDELDMRLLDIVLAFPQIVLAIALAAVLGPSLTNVILIVGLLQVPHFARVVRGSVLSIKTTDYVVAARIIGLSELRILVQHVVPNTLGPVIVLASLAIPEAITAEAALSFLGLGVQPPAPSWGNLLADGRQYLLEAPWLATFPGLVITLAVLAFNFVGDGLRDALDPRSAR
jgi:peptide/nickel transport system permease protein